MPAAFRSSTRLDLAVRSGVLAASPFSLPLLPFSLASFGFSSFLASSFGLPLLSSPFAVFSVSFVLSASGFESCSFLSFGRFSDFFSSAGFSSFVVASSFGPPFSASFAPFSSFFESSFAAFVSSLSFFLSLLLSSRLSIFVFSDFFSKKIRSAFHSASRRKSYVSLARIDLAPLGRP